jgi:putative hydrolase of the HAD superfamily
MPKGIIFDVNGTILDDELLWDRAFKGVLAEYDIPAVGFRHTPGIGVENNWLLMTQTFPQLAAQPFAQLVESTNERYFESLPTEGRVRDGYANLVHALKQKEYRLSIATSISRTVFERESELFPEITKNIEVIVTGDDVKNRKPAPDLFLRAAELLGLTSVQCVVFEDSIQGLHAAQIAKMAVVLIKNPLLDYRSLTPDLLVEDFNDPKIMEFLEPFGVAKSEP